jgi:hypothetical protein
MFRKRKKETQIDRRQVNNLSNRQASTLSYRSSRSNRGDSTGRYNVDEQAARSVADRTNILKSLPAYIAILVVLVSIIYAITLSPIPKIEIVGSSSNSFLQSTNIYAASAQQLLKDSLTNKTKLSINTDKLAADLSSKYPELGGVTVVVPLLGHQPIFEIKPSQSTIILSNAQGKYVINQSGAAVLQLETSKQYGKYNLPQVTDQSGLTVNLNEKVLPTSTISFINTVIKQFAAKNVPIQSMTLVNIPYELNVQVRGEPYYIKFNLLADPNYSVGTYLATVKQLATSHTTPTQYIDVRIPGRAYYQ